MMLLALVSAGVLSGCGNTTPKAPTYSGSIIGQLIDNSDSTKYIGGAKISVEGFSKTTTSTSDGKFKLENVPFEKDTILVTITCSEYLTKTTSFTVTKEIQQKKEKDLGIILLKATPEIYISGEATSSINNNHYACYWHFKENGSIKKEELGSGRGKSIYVKNNLVYILDINGYWIGKNKVPLTGTLNSMCIYNDNVYIGGSYSGFPCYWKGTEKHSLSTSSGTVNSIYVYRENIIYTAGHVTEEQLNKNISKGCYWNNNNINYLLVNSGYVDEISSLFFDNGTLHTVGYKANVPSIGPPTINYYYWKDTNLQENLISGKLIYIYNKKPYIVSEYNNLYVDNEVVFKSNWEQKERVNALYVYDNIIYMVGSYQIDNTIYPCYWIAEQPNKVTRYDLTDNSGARTTGEALGLYISE